MGAGHDHGTGEIKYEKPLWWAFGLTASFLVAEVVGAMVTNSLALLSDAMKIQASFGDSHASRKSGRCRNQSSAR